MSVIKGDVLKYGDNINTDIISPPQFMEYSIEESAKYAMSAIDPNFSKRVKKGDIIVAGKNFGSGSSRETSPLTLKYLGVSAIVAQFFARIFYRNAINVGIPVVECNEADAIKDGDVIEIDLENGIIKNISADEVYQCTRISPHVMELINDGGLVAYIKKNMERK